MARSNRRAVETGEYYQEDAEFLAELNKILTPDGKLRPFLIHDSGQKASGERDTEPEA
jgi:hypothetical protein